MLTNFEVSQIAKILKNYQKSNYRADGSIKKIIRKAKCIVEKYIWLSTTHSLKFKDTRHSF